MYGPRIPFHFYSISSSLSEDGGRGGDGDVNVVNLYFLNVV